MSTSLSEFLDRIGLGGKRPQFVPDPQRPGRYMRYVEHLKQGEEPDH